MSFKLVLVFASLAAASCATVDLTEHMANQMQKQVDDNNFHNDRIREHQELTEQQRQIHIENMNEQMRMQEQKIRDQNQERFNQARENHRYTIQVFTPHNHRQTPAIVHIASQPAVINIPASSRHLNVHDDSNYNFRYAVSDMTTGDIKTHQETRRGDEVQGQYTMMDSDGYHRIVKYRANDRDGFDADVRREPAVAVLAIPQNQQQFVNLHGFTNYPGHHNQHNFSNNKSHGQWKRN